MDLEIIEQKPVQAVVIEIDDDDDDEDVVSSPNRSLKRAASSPQQDPAKEEPAQSSSPKRPNQEDAATASDQEKPQSSQDPTQQDAQTVSELDQELRKEAQPEAIAKPEPPPTPLGNLKLKATDEFYRLPFAYGWKRELVLPSNGNPKRRTGDVFFIAPSGRKLRSREDIIPLLEGELTIEHFCFQRQPQEAGPEWELVRRATPAPQRAKSQAQAQALQSAPLAVTGKRVSKPKVPKGASPPSEGWTATSAVKGNARVLAASNGSGGAAGGGGAAAGPSGSATSRKRRYIVESRTHLESS